MEKESSPPSPISSEKASSFTTYLVPRQQQQQQANNPVSKILKVEEKTTIKKNNNKTRALPPPNSITQFSQLQVSTNLNSPPSNWLLSSSLSNLQGFAATPHSTGFSSFHMASQFLEFLKDVDVLADAENIKKMLKMPYSKAPVSMVVHRVGKALLIDEFDIHGFLLRSSAKEWEWLKRFFYETVFNSIEEKKKALVKKDMKKEAITNRNLISKFLYHSSIEREKQKSFKEENDETEEEQEQKEEEEIVVEPEGEEEDDVSAKMTVNLPPLPEASVDPKSHAHEFARNLIWNFEDIRMLIGSDMPIFGDDQHPAVSLRLHDKRKPINILTGLDYWLDNLMCQVPEVLMCYHVDGIVQRYELIQTEDLPNLKGCEFSPKAIRDVAKNILSFLKSNAAKEGHTYWLFKGKDDDVVKLYDLTSLTESKGNVPRSPDENPFRTAVSMLLYKVARNILQGDERSSEEGTVKQLLQNCLSLLDTDKFPHIATSAHFMMSDLYMPESVDPACPKFADMNNVEEDEVKTNILPNKNSPFKPRKSSNYLSSSNPKAVEIQTLLLPHMGVIDDKETKPQRLTSNVLERSNTALVHVLEGLQFLKIMCDKRAEEKLREEKERELRERDNPKMSRPGQPIPMPYHQPESSQLVETSASKNGRSRFISESSIVAAPPTPQKVETLSWHDHLKMVLLKKAFLVYITLAESNFTQKKYGATLKCVKRALNCYKTVKVINPNLEDKSSVLSFAFGVAGDSYMAMVKDWENLVNFQEEFNFCSEIDFDLANEIEFYVDEDLRDWMIKLPKDIEEALLLGYKCLKHGIYVMKDRATKVDLDFMRRIGNTNNELGVFYMNQAAALAKELDGHLPDIADNCDVSSSSSKDRIPESVRSLFDKSMSHLKEGIENFESANDIDNRALLNSNCGRLCRLYAFTFAQMDTMEVPEFSEEEMRHYRDALYYYESAMKALGSRKRSPQIWDTIVWELSGTLFTLGSQLQDFAPISEKPKDEIRKRVTDYLMKALHYCDLDTTGPKLEMYQFRAASVHYRLATMYQKTIIDKEDQTDAKSHQLRRLAESHYKKSFDLYTCIEHWTECLRIQIEMLSLNEMQLEQKSATNHNKGKNLVPIFDALIRCQPILKAFGKENNSNKEIEKNKKSANRDDEEEESDDERDSLLKLFLHKLQQYLLNLNKGLTSSTTARKGANNNKNKDLGVKAKQIYAKSLKCDLKKRDFFEKSVELLKELEVELLPCLK